MGRRRLDLSSELHSIVGANVYFQPSENTEMHYPCIVYELSDIHTRRADNQLYIDTEQYKITVIDEDPDSALPGEIIKLPMCRFNRFYTADNLNHWVFILYV